MILLDENTKKMEMSGIKEQAYMQVLTLLYSYLVSLKDRKLQAQAINTLATTLNSDLKNNDLRNSLYSFAYLARIDSDKFDKECKKILKKGF